MFMNLSLLRIFSLNEWMQLRRARKWGWEGILKGHYLTRTIQTLFNVGFLDELRQKEWVNALDFAETHELHPDLLIGLCDALSARRILRKEGRRYALDRDGRFLVEHDLVRGWFYLTYGYEEVLYQMEPLLRQQIRYGKELTRDGEYVARGSGYSSTSFYFPVAAELIRRNQYHKVLDLGCGDGTFLRYLCTKVAAFKGVGVDLSANAVRAGNQQNVEHELGEQLHLYQGDIFNLESLQDQLGGVDAVTSFFVFHEFCDRKDNARVIQLLRRLRELLEGVPIILFETVRPDTEELRRRPGPAVEYFLFHDLSNQVPQTRSAWMEVFRSAGFQSIQERYLKLVRSAIYILQ